MKLRILKVRLIFCALALVHVSATNAAPFAIKDIELGMPPDAYPALEIEDHCRLLGFGTLLQCFARKNIEIRTSIAGDLMQ